MRGKTAKKLRKLAVRLEGSAESSLYQMPQGNVLWDGVVRKYKDLKKAWKEGKWDLNKGCK